MWRDKTMTSEYSSHPSYEHYNVDMWVSNDKMLYNLAVKSKTDKHFIDFLNAIGFTKTPDGVKVTSELAKYAWERCKETDD